MLEHELYSSENFPIPYIARLLHLTYSYNFL